jgi:hypothetical protein
MIDLKEEQQYRELKRLARKLNVPIPEVFIELEVRNKDGRVIQMHRQRSHSWTRNAYNIIYYYLSAVQGTEANGLRCQMTNSTWHPIPYVMASSNNVWDSVGQGYRCYAGYNTMGIVVGTGVGEESFESYQLGTIIASGAGAGQLSYTEQEAPDVSTVGTTKKTIWVRYFNNNSGGSIGVNEVGLIIYFCYQGGFYLTERNKLSSTVTVPNTGQLKVTYTIQLTYPS